MRLYRWILGLAPATLDREYGVAMEETVKRRLTDARAHGRGRFAQVFAREMVSLVVLVLAERRARPLKLRQGDTGRRAGPFGGWIREARHAARRLRRTPAFTAASVLTVAIGIGVNVAIFAVVYRVAIRPLPYPASERLIQLDHGMPRINLSAGVGMTPGLYHQYLDGARSLEAVAIYRTTEQTVTGRGEPERVEVAGVTTTLAGVLRTGPAVGRWFTAEEGTPGGDQVAIISRHLWQRSFGAADDVLGEALTLDGVTTRIVGVMPPGFAFPNPQVDVWVPVQLSRSAGFSLPFSYLGVGRMRDGSSASSVRDDLDRLIADLPRVFPGDVGVAGNVGPGGLTSAAISLRDATIGRIERLLWTLFAAVSLVLLVAAANVANLFLVRIDARQREVAVRRALGAGRSSIAGFFFAESAWLAGLGVVLGVGIAAAGVQLLVRFGPAGLPRLDEIQIDGAVLAFAGALGVVTALMLAALPFLRRAQIASGLHEGGRANTMSAAHFRLRHTLMGAQVAMAFVLVVAAGLMLRSIDRLRLLDPGFDASSALTFRLVLPARDYSTRASSVAAHDAVLERVRAIPGVTAVSAGTSLPLQDGCTGNTILVRGHPVPPGTTPPLVHFCAVAAGFHEAMGIRLVRGRPLAQGDIQRNSPSVVVNQAFADVVLGGRVPLGEHVRSNAPPGPGAMQVAPGELTWDGAPPWLEVVGVVANTPTRALAEPSPVPTVYMPMSIAGGPDVPARAMLGPDVASMRYVVRTNVSANLMFAIRAAVDAVDPRLAVADVQTLDRLVAAASGEMTFTTILLALAAAVAVSLGVVGIYGVTSYVVAQRTSEIGVRLAFGAAPEAVARLIVRQGGSVALAGIVVGLVAALAGARLMESLLYGVSARDPLMFAVTALLMLVVAIAACWIPARRAARLSPVEALRAE